MRKTFSGILFVLLLVSVFTGAFNVKSAKASASSRGGTVQTTGTDWWPMFHHDLSHTGTSTSTAPIANNLLWTYTTGVIVWSSPAVVGGFVYVGSFDADAVGKIYCLKAVDGSLVWSCTNGSCVDSSPAVVGGFVYVGSYDGNVHCLNAANGSYVWSRKTGGVVYSSPAVVGGRVYVGSLDDNVYCLNATTGTIIWSYTTGSHVESSPAVVGGFVYVGSEDGKVYCLNTTTRLPVWSYTTHSNVSSSPAVVGGLVFVGSSDGGVYCLNATTGVLVWSYTTGAPVYSSPAVVNRVVYVGSWDGKIYAFGARAAVSPTGGAVGITGYKLVFKETMNNTLGSPALIDYYWSLSIDKWNGAQWVASGISGSSATGTGYIIPALSTVDLPYYVYLLPLSDLNTVKWGDWFRISYAFHWTYSGTNYSTDYTAKLHLHPADITGATPVAFPYLGADRVCDISDAAMVGANWHKTVPPGSDPMSLLARADLTGDGIVDISDAAIIGVSWHRTWTNTPPP